MRAKQKKEAVKKIRKRDSTPFAPSKVSSFHESVLRPMRKLVNRL